MLCYFAQTQPLSTLFSSPCHSYSSHFNSAHTQLYINSDTAQDVLLLLIFFKLIAFHEPSLCWFFFSTATTDLIFKNDRLITG